jgi:dynein heavy chain 1
MDFTVIRVLEAMFALVRKGISNVLEYNESHPDFELEDDKINKYMTKWVLHSVMWGIGGDMKLYDRAKYSAELLKVVTDIEVPQIDN